MRKNDSEKYNMFQSGMDRAIAFFLALPVVAAGIGFIMLFILEITA